MNKNKSLLKLIGKLSKIFRVKNCTIYTDAYTRAYEQLTVTLELQKKSNSGFTLLEILIAIAVFAILATLTSSALYYAFNTRARVTEQADRFTSLQLAISLLERDSLQVVNRPVRGNEMHLFPAFIGQASYLEFTRGGLANPNSIEKRSTLLRVGLLCKDNQLIRRTWPSLDPANKDQHEDRVLLDNLTKCHFAYLNKSLQVLPSWNVGTGELEQVEPLPKAIQLTLTINQRDKLSLLLPIPKANYAS
ncbi:type II secretion system minor pseudopilin GspJ [Legionella sp. CNM-1927-20]|uniref:type II secretion system minor pseudopilin GspJ n=1 Tax=Legionella sp. CNM-1927-20 TaxID=3422221 RepID=UPI00403B1B5F